MGNTNSSLIVAIVGTAVIGVLSYKLFKSKNSETKNSEKKKVALVNPDVKYSFPLISREKLTHDTRRLRFALPQKDQVLGLPIGKHVYLSAIIDGENVIRPYTPTSSDEDNGYFELVLKVYFSNVNPKFPKGGKMTQFLESMKIGESINVRGPSGRLEYTGNGAFEIRQDKKTPPTIKRAKKIGMIAGGTGITPMYQLIKHIATNEKGSNISLSLIFANQSEEDILLRDELEQLQKLNSESVKIWYTIDAKKTDKDWPFDIGFVNDKMFESHLPKPSDDTFILMCGPPGMINFACHPNLEKLGYTKDMIFSY